MSMSSVTPTTSHTATPTDANGTDSGVDAPKSGFDMLLAAHTGTHAEGVARDTKDSCEGRPDPNGSPAGTDPTVNSEAPKKPDQTVDAEGLAAQLAAQAAPPATPLPEPASPPVADPLDSAAVLEAAAAGSPTVQPDAPALPASDGTDTTALLLDVAPKTLDPNLTALLVATASNDAALPSIASVPLPSFLNDHASSPAPSEKSNPTPPPAPTGPPPGLAANDPARPDRPRSAPTDTGSVGFTPTNGPAAVTSNPATVNAEVAATTTPPVPPPPAEQLVSVLSPLRATPNGSYTLRLELKPVELGRIEMRVEMRDGVLHASIHADHDSSAQLVRASLNELREQLAAEGVRTGNLTVSDSALGSSGRDGNTREAGGDSSRRGATSEAGLTDEPNRPSSGEVEPTVDSDPSSLLDVRV